MKVDFQVTGYFPEGVTLFQHFRREEVARECATSRSPEGWAMLDEDTLKPIGPERTKLHKITIEELEL